MERKCEEGETTTKSFIEKFEDEINVRKVEDTLCYKITKNKFHCIMLILVIILTMLQIIKLAIPSMNPEDLKTFSDTIMKAVRKLKKTLQNSTTTTTTTTPIPNLLNLTEYDD